MPKKLLLVPLFASTCAFTQTAQTIPAKAHKDATYVHNLSSGKVTTGAPGTPASAVVTNTPTGSVLNIMTPQGLTGSSSIVPGLTPDGANGFMLTGNIRASRINSLRYAANYQTGAGNNGIANAASDATGQVVVADPSYGLTELPKQSSFAAQSFHFQDLRNGQQVDYFHNPNYSAIGTIPVPSGWFGQSNQLFTAHNLQCLFDITPASIYGSGLSPTGNTTTIYGCQQINHTRINPGWSIGNPGVGSSYGWNVDIGDQVNTIINGSGITESLYINQHKYGVGDNAPLYVYTYGEGGWTAPSDQGMQGIGNNVTEDPQEYVGRVTVSATGPTQLTSTPTYGGGMQGTGRYLTDVGACSSYPTCPGGPYTGTVTAIGSGLGGVGSALTISGIVPVSNAWGTLASSVSVPLVTVPPFTTSETFNVNVLSGTFDTTHLVCSDSKFHEQAIPTAVGTPSGGVQSVTIPWRRAHAAGSHIYQGGMCGYGIEFPAYTQTPQGVPLRYLFDVVGSTGANTLQAVKFTVGGASGVPAYIYVLNINSGLTNGGSGTTVTGTNAGGGMYQPWFVTNHGTILISGASDSALNAVCTNVLWSSTSTFTCAIAGLSGSHTSKTSSTSVMATSSGAPLTNYNLRPIAEVLDVRNNSVSPPTVDGTLTIEPNVIPMVRGDYLEETHHYSQNMTAKFDSHVAWNPYSQYFGTDTEAQGAGVCCGGNSVASNALNRLYNLNSDSMYQEGGGFLSPPNAFAVAGNYYNYFSLDHGPSPLGAFVNMFSTIAQQSDPNYAVNMLILYGRLGVSIQQYYPHSGNSTFSTPGVATWAAARHIFTGPVSMPSGSTIAGQALAPLASPALTGTPTAPTAAPGTNTSQIATMAALQAGLQTIGRTCGNPLPSGQLPLTGTTGSIGGSALTAGTCASGTATVMGATTNMATVVTPAAYPGDAYTWKGYVSATNKVTVKVCTNLAAGGTPTASTYNVRVIP